MGAQTRRVDHGPGSPVAATVALAAALAAAGIDAQAQSAARPTTGTAGATLERVRPEPVDPGRAPLPERAGAPGGAAVIAVDPETRFTLADVRLEGATLFGPEELARFWEASVGAEIGAAEIARIAGDVQAFYRGEGYVFTRAVAARDGDTLRLIVVETEIVDVAIEEPQGSVGPVAALLRRLASPLIGLKNPTLADIERVVLLMNDVPGVTRATAVPRGGDGGPGAVALSFNVERDPVSGALFADNRQQPAFGEGLAGAFVEFGGWSSGGDSTALTFSNTFWSDIDDFEERTILEVNHSRYFGPHGTRAGLRVLGSRSRPGDALEPLDLEGTEVEVEAYVEHPLVRTRALSLWARGGLEYADEELSFRASGDTITEDRTRSVYFELEAQMRDPYGFTELVFGVRKGLDLFDASEQGDARLSRFDANPQAAILYGQAEREVWITENIALYGLVAGQYAGSPLVGGEEFALGGTTFGRGYDPSEAVGDHGVGGAFELRVRDDFVLEDAPIRAELYGFTDLGKVWNRGDGTPEEKELASYGFGARATVNNALFLEAELAKPTSNLVRTDSDAFRFFMTAQYRF
jgi:hemolysin activation/secretion protein